MPSNRGKANAVHDDSNAAVVLSALEGDQRAIAELFDRHADRIYSFCRVHLDSSDAAAAATRSIFVRAAGRLAKLSDPSRVRPWLYAISRQELVSIHGARHAEGPGVTRHSPSRNVEGISLSEKEREVFELHLRHDLDGAELADALSISLSDAVRVSERIAASMAAVDVTSRSLPLEHAPTDLGRRTIADMAASLGFGPAVLAKSELAEDGQNAMSLRSNELWPTPPRNDDDWQWRDDGFPVEATQRSLGPVLSVPVLVVAVLLVLAGVATASLLLRPADVEVAGVAEVSARSAGDDRAQDDASRLIGKPNTPSGDQEADAAEVARPSTGIATTSDTSPASLEGGTSPTTASPSSSGLPTIPVAPTTVSETTSSSVATSISGENPAPITTQPFTTTTSRQTTTTRRSSSTRPATTSPAEVPTPFSTATPSSSSSSSTTQATTTTSTSPTTTSATSTTTTSPTTTSPTTTSTTTTSTTTTSTTTTSTTTTTLPPNGAPGVSNVGVRPGSVRVNNGCTGREATVSATVTDTDGQVASVIARWSADGQNTITTQMVDIGSSTFEAVIGPWIVVGTAVIEVVATDDDSATTVASDTVRVRSCPGN